MKIAYISSDFGISVSGYKGASVHIREIASAFSNLNNDVTIFSPCTENHSNSSNQFKVVEVKKSEVYDEISRQIRIIDNQVNVKNKLNNDIKKYLYNLTLYNSLIPVFKKEKFDLVYERYSVFNYAGISIARKFKIPHFLEVNAPLCDEHDKMIGFTLKDLAYKIENIVLKNSDHIFVVSEYLKKFAEKHGVPDENLSVLPNGVDTKKFKNDTNKRNLIRSKYNIDNNIVIGFIGNIRPWHGIDKLINSFTEAREKQDNIHLLIVGNSHKEKELEKLIKKSKYSKNITLTGYIPHEEMPSYISAMDITVAPYNDIDDFYFSPMKILEYMACSKPVVAAGLGQVNEIINVGKNGVIYKAGDRVSLTNSLSYLINNKFLWTKLGRSARQWIKKNRNWENNIKLITQVYFNIHNKSIN